MTKRLSVLFALLVVLTLALSACGPATTTVPPTAVPPTAVPPTAVPPTATEPPAPTVGTADNPLVMALAPSATSQELQTGGEAIAAKLTELTGYTIKTVVPTNYAAMVEAMGSGNAHIGWLPPLAYMLAKDKGYADVGLVVLRADSDHYGFQYVSNAARVNTDGTPMFTSFFDPATGKSTADAATALKQFEGKKPCWTDPLSASGYVLPFGLLAKEGVKTKAGAWVQGHPTVINSVYLSPNGEICDFGATYIDARTAVVKSFPDVNDKVVVIYVSDPIIPNDNVSFASTLPADVRQSLSDALLQLASTEEGRALLKNGGYDIGGLKVVDDTFYDEFRVLLEAAGYDYTNFK
jgi:phosphonate transport system substrate-binding protein